MALPRRTVAVVPAGAVALIVERAGPLPSCAASTAPPLTTSNQLVTTRVTIQRIISG